MLSKSKNKSNKSSKLTTSYFILWHLTIIYAVEGICDTPRICMVEMLCIVMCAYLFPTPLSVTC